MLIRTTLIMLPLVLMAGETFANDARDLSKAREALSKQDNDADTEKALEEVFEAAEKSYSLLRQGGMALNYNFDYS